MAREDRESYVELMESDAVQHINYTALQYTELYMTNKHKYLLIHRNGSSTIRTHMKNDTTTKPYVGDGTDSSVVLWTVLRDPYDRFIDALAYDMEYAGIEVSNSTIDSLVGTTEGLLRYIQGASDNHIMRESGFVKHANPQFTYLFDNRVDMYVDLEDLDAFCALHFPGPKNLRVNAENTEDKDLVSTYFDSRPLLKKYVQGIFSSDYAMMAGLKAQQKKWEWYMGKIW